MPDTDIPELDFDIRERIEAIVKSEEKLFSRNLSDRGYILKTEDGKRKWRLKESEIKGDDFEKGDRIRITLENGRMMKPWPRGTSRSTPTEDEPEQTFRVKNLSSDGRD